MQSQYRSGPIVTSFQWMTLFALLSFPLLVAWHLQYTESGHLIFKNLAFHEFAVALAIANGVFVTIVSHRCYQRSRDPILYYLTLAFAAFTILYSFHGILTRTIVYHPPLFLLYGPVSRLGMALLFCVAIYQYAELPKKQLLPRPLLTSRSGWAVIASLFLLEPVIAFASGGALHPIRVSMEIASMVLLLATLYPIARVFRRSAIRNYLVASIFLMVESCVLFILAKPFDHLWWFTHFVFAAGFLILSYGVTLIYQSTGSFSDAYVDESELERLVNVRKQTMGSLGALAESLNILIWEWAGDGHRPDMTTYMNQYARETFGVDQRDLSTRCVREILSAALPPDVVEKFDVLSMPNFDGSAVEDFTFEVLVKEEVRHWVHVKASVAPGWKNERVCRLVGVDITDLKRAEFRAIEAERFLAQVSRHQAVSQSTGGIAHEVNNMLQPLFLSTGLIKLELPQEVLERANFPEAEAQVHRVRSWLKQMLDAQGSDSEADYPNHSIIDATVSEVVDSVRNSVGAGRVIHLALDEANVVWSLSRSETFQVLMNLVTNALHAMEGIDGPIEITGRQEADLGERGYRLKIRDTGVGIDASHLARVFEPMFTTKAPGRGSGLGLTIVKNIVERHGGTVEIESRPAEGSTVTCWIPLEDVSNQAGSKIA